MHVLKQILATAFILSACQSSGSGTNITSESIEKSVDVNTQISRPGIAPQAVASPLNLSPSRHDAYKYIRSDASKEAPCADIVDEITKSAEDSGLHVLSREHKDGTKILTIYDRTSETQSKVIYGLVLFTQASDRPYTERCRGIREIFDVIKM
jgi:hypothetical protein